MFQTITHGPVWSRVCYGVDVSGGQPIVLRGALARGGVSCAPVDPDGPALAGELARGRAVLAACMLERESLTRWLNTPLLSRSKAAKVLPSVLDIQLPFPLEECVSVFIDAAAGRKGDRRVLAVVARSPDVEKRLAVLNALGLDPHLLDQEGLALWTQSLHEMPADGAAWRVVVYLGPDRATAAVGTGGSFIAAHTMRQMRTDELGRFLRAHLAADGGPTAWCWAGPGAEDGSAVDGFLRDLAARWPGPSAVHREPRLFLARALVTRALLPGPFRCNLRAGAFMHPVLVRKAERRLLTNGLILFLAGLLLCGTNLGWQGMVSSRDARIHAAVLQLSSEISGIRKPPKGQEMLVAQRALDRDSEAMAPFIRAFEPSVVATLGGVLGAVEANSVVCESLVLRGRSVAIEGVADDWGQCEKLSSRLAELGFKHRLDRRVTPAAGKASFTIIPADSP